MIEIIAHRGVPPLEPENTMLSFRRAVMLGAKHLEMDIRSTRDLIPVIIHDPTLRRTTNGRGRVAKMTFEHVRSFDAGKGESIPALSQVLDEFGGKIFLHLDVKWRPALRPMLEMIGTRGIERDVCISSFDHSILRDVKKFNPHIKTAALVRRRKRRFIPYLHNLGVDAVHIPFRSLTRSLVHLLHRGGLKVRVWQIEETPENMKTLFEWKVDGAILDRSDIFLNHASPATTSQKA